MFTLRDLLLPEFRHNFTIELEPFTTYPRIRDIPSHTCWNVDEYNRIYLVHAGYVFFQRRPNRMWPWLVAPVRSPDVVVFGVNFEVVDTDNMTVLWMEALLKVAGLVSFTDLLARASETRTGELGTVPPSPDPSASDVSNPPTASPLETHAAS